MSLVYTRFKSLWVIYYVVSSQATLAFCRDMFRVYDELLEWKVMDLKGLMTAPNSRNATAKPTQADDQS